MKAILPSLLSSVSLETSKSEKMVSPSTHLSGQNFNFGSGTISVYFWVYFLIMTELLCMHCESIIWFILPLSNIRDNIDFSFLLMFLVILYNVFVSTKTAQYQLFFYFLKTYNSFMFSLNFTNLDGCKTKSWIFICFSFFILLIFLSSLVPIAFQF